MSEKMSEKTGCCPREKKRCPCEQRLTKWQEVYLIFACFQPMTTIHMV